MRTCMTCKEPIVAGQKRTIIHWDEGDDEQHHRDCLSLAIGRAKAAEERVRDLEEQISTGFLLSRAQVEEVMAAVRRAYKNRGIPTFQYWRMSEAGLAHYGDLLADALQHSNRSLFIELWDKVDE